MFTQLFIGGVVITLSIFTQAVLFGLIESVFLKYRPWLERPPRVFKMVLVMILVVILIMIGVSFSTWMWAVLYLILGISANLEEAVYFATVNLTTLGYGDIIPNKTWRLLTVLTPANGMIIFGMSTAFLMELLYELRMAQRNFLLKKESKKQIKKQIRKQLKKL